METSKKVTPFTVVYAPPDGVTAAAYPGLIGLPVIFDRGPGIHRLALRFLLDLAYAKWCFPGGFLVSTGVKMPTHKSMRTIAARLANFLDWADRRALDLRTSNYSQGAARYQHEMLSGVWSRSGRGLETSTVNVRVDVATHYLRWLADIGERDRFDVLTKEISQTYGRHDGSRKSIKTVTVREGRLKTKPKVLTLPTKRQAVDWLKEARCVSGPTSALMAESVLRTGMRREELICLRVDSLPLSPCDWEVANPTQPPHLQEIVIRLEWGPKGETIATCPISGDERKVGRDIRVPRTLALEWHEYRKKSRVRAVGKRLAGLKGRQREEVAASLVHLFLRDDTGDRWSGKKFYDAWVAVPRVFADRWYPHAGRHWWACMTLWDEVMRLEAEGHTKENLLSIIMTRIQPQLGHLSEDTTMLYLRWAMNQLGTPLVLDETDEKTGADPSPSE
jgi:hypothetical protein